MVLNDALDKLFVTLDTSKYALLNDPRECERVVKPGGTIEIEVRGLLQAGMPELVIALSGKGFAAYKGENFGGTQRFVVTTSTN